METTYILTAELDEESFAWLDGLRREHFPPERNFLPAHLTMFHRLTPEQVFGLQSLELPRAPLAIVLDRLVFLGSGVAVHVQSAELDRLRNEVRAALGGEISRQDSQAWKPHVTIQNKASGDVARQLHRALDGTFAQRSGTATGLLVWEYLGGPWKLAERIAFRTFQNDQPAFR